ncbi:EAL domain-containing protein [Pseudoalteromonas sp. SSDWG2]|uniref:bifunctional diguanylate cyclase/phosphodiesterase n=1 Tax=Pseudoalteromonas sp. SSDWG2 TaxID=3139391 RepID=UPI003BAC7058
MTWWQRASVQTKTTIITTACSAIAVCLALAFNFAYLSQGEKDRLHTELEIVSAIIADRSTAAIQYYDQNTGQRNLLSLSNFSAIIVGCLYTEDNVLFASYQRDQVAGHKCENTLKASDSVVTDDSMALVTDVVLDKQVIGSLYIKSDLSTVQTTIEHHGMFALAIVVVTILVSALLATGAQRILTQPIERLRSTVLRIKHSGDYSMRANKDTEDEVGELVDAFNAMLEEIEDTNDFIKRSEERFRTLTSASTIGIFQLDKKGAIVYKNKKFSHITENETQYSDLKDIIDVVHNEDREKVQSKLEYALKRQQSVEIEFRLITNIACPLHVVFSMKPLRIDEHAIEGFIGSLTDVTELATTQDQLRQLALYDDVTHIANRHLFNNRLEKAIQCAVRDNLDIAVFFFDLDNFKKINDTYGHDLGDKLLLEVASAMKKCIRPGDTIARMGGDEFTVLIPKLDSPLEARIIAERFQKALNAPMVIDGKEIIVTASIGLVISHRDNMSSVELLKNADIAMYRAKALGRNQYLLFSEELQLQIEHQINIERELKSAIHNGQLYLCYQPQIDLTTHELIGFEALIRWHHPLMGYIPPDEFIPIAEESELILALGEMVIEQATQALSAMINANVLTQNARVAINLSARQFRDPNLVSHIKRCVSANNISYNAIEFEITETLLMQNIDKSRQILDSFTELGATVAIDDFGTGYSSLSYLKQFPIDLVKIDRTFINDIPNDKNDMELTSAIIAMSHALGMKVIAEGIETQEQMDFLTQRGCNYGQGYLFSEPKPLDFWLENAKEKQCIP